MVALAVLFASHGLTAYFWFGLAKNHNLLSENLVREVSMLRGEWKTNQQKKLHKCNPFCQLCENNNSSDNFATLCAWPWAQLSPFSCLVFFLRASVRWKNEMGPWFCRKSWNRNLNMNLGLSLCIHNIAGGGKVGWGAAEIDKTFQKVAIETMSSYTRKGFLPLGKGLRTMRQGRGACTIDTHVTRISFFGLLVEVFFLVMNFCENGKWAWETEIGLIW